MRGIAFGIRYRNPMKIRFALAGSPSHARFLCRLPLQVAFPSKNAAPGTLTLSPEPSNLNPQHLTSTPSSPAHMIRLYRIKNRCHLGVFAVGLELLSWSLGSTPDLTLRAPGPTFWAFTGADSAFQKKKPLNPSVSLGFFPPTYLFGFRA